MIMVHVTSLTLKIVHSKKKQEVVSILVCVYVTCVYVTDCILILKTFENMSG